MKGIKVACRLAMAAVAALWASRARAGSPLEWDINAAAGIQGGAGSWNTGTANWNDGVTRIQWNNSRGDTAVFGGTAGGPIGVTSALTAAAIEFDTAGYTIGSISSPAMTLSAGSVIANADGVIAVPISTPAGLTKSGAGVLSFLSSNTIRGPISIVDGTLSYTVDAQLGATSNAIELAGGALRYAGNSPQTLPSGRKVIVDAAGGRIDLSNGGLGIGTTGQLQGTGTLVKIGTQKLTIAAANSNFQGTIELDTGSLSLENGGAVNGRPITLTGGTLLLHAEQSTTFGSDLTVAGDATVDVDRLTTRGNIDGVHTLGNLTVNQGATLALSSIDRYHALVQNADILGTVHLSATGLEVSGALTGDGGITFAPLQQSPELFKSGLLFSGGAARTFANPLSVDDGVEASVVVGVDAGTTITYNGPWSGGGESASSTLVLRDGGHFIVGPAAHLNTLTADVATVRPFVVAGNGATNVIELDSGMTADRTAGGTVADGFAGLEVRDATLLTRSTQSLPVVVKNSGFGGTHRAGTIVFSGTGGSAWNVATANQRYDGGVKFNASTTLLTDKDLTHSGSIAGKFDGEFQIPQADVVVTKQGAGWLNLSGSQGYAPGSRIVVQGGGVRFNTDPGAGWYDGNYTRGADGNVATAPTPAGTLTLVVGGASAPTVEFAAPVSRIDGLQIDAGGKARIAATPQAGLLTLHANALSVSGSGQLDVANNRMVLDYDGSASPLADVATMIRGGFNAGGPHWQGSGINSSVAAANVGMAVGYAEASDVLQISGNDTALFGGDRVDASSVLVRFTRVGDADLDGVVTFADFQRLEEGLGKSGQGWSGGDFNYDGLVDDADYKVFYVSYSLGLSADGSVVGVLPEPVGVGMILPVAAMALTRRRRRARP